METSARLQYLLSESVELARKWRHEYVTPEHFLYVLTKEEEFIECFTLCGGDPDALRKQLKKHFKKNYEALPEGAEITEIYLSRGFQAMLERGAIQADSSGKEVLELTHVFFGMMQLPECYATYYMAKQDVDLNDVFFELCYLQQDNEMMNDIAPDRFDTSLEEEEEWAEDGSELDGEMGDYEALFFNEGEMGRHSSKKKNAWMKYVTCLNDLVEEPDYTPLVGRDEELARTILVLCRRGKNNPLHIGESGVGKTAITYGLTKRIVDGKVPELLKDAKVFAIDMGNMVAGTQYRGDFEKRMKKVLDGIEAEEKPIVYLDEIHNVIGAGAVSGGSLDASNILKPYLVKGHIRFIGATTYDEYKKHFEQSKAMVRRFQKVDIKEPSAEESVAILEGIKEYYEQFHNVIYSKEMIELIVHLTDKYINERCLPDKAIDLLDEAGAMLNLRAEKDESVKRVVTKELLEEVISTYFKVPLQTIASEESEQLATLDKCLMSKVFGQDEAVAQICNSIKMSRAGLNEDNKPIASFLFVGPTGVGKTEIARALASTLGVELVRFDMSEYMEKHAVAKFIGAPAGYVGYEEGGMLTDAIRKKPHCVLLLDEIEKAHNDIYNVLLQVMDYATLSDNQGRKADFRNVIIIMTSNAGASKLGKPLPGFSNSTDTVNQSAIDEAVKNTFSPEFRNRLSRIVTFRAIDKSMAERIVKKQCQQLADHLKAKNVQITFAESLQQHILKEGVSQEYGARQIQRVIDSEVKPVLVEEILFGFLKNGGSVELAYEDDKVVMKQNG